MSTNLRGRLPGTAITVADLPPLVLPIEPLPVPRCPRGLGKQGKQTWRTLWQCMPWLDLDQHGLVVRLVCDLVDQIDLFQQELAQRGPLLEEPIVTPKGEIVGTRLVPNPVVYMLRKAGQEQTRSPTSATMSQPRERISSR